MGRPWVNRGLGIALAVSAVLNVVSWAARRPGAPPNVEYFPDMAHSARYNAFEANPNFGDGMTLRPPVPGTIPRGLPPLIVDDAFSQPNPFSPDDRAAVARGAVVFNNFCAPCHDEKALGVGPVVKHGFPPPPPLRRGQTQEKTDAQLFQVVTNGINTMPPYASQLSRDDRWKAVLHVRSFRPN